jgi:transposase
MRQTHAAGEKLFVDFAGDTLPVFDGLTGEVRTAKIFVAVLGASNYTFAQARFSEALPDWIGAHVDALSFLGGAPKALVCDNLKAGVTVASRYEPGINRTYQDLAAHYGTTIMPARPRNKAKVEAAVLIVQRWTRWHSPAAAQQQRAGTITRQGPQCRLTLLAKPKKS